MIKRCSVCRIEFDEGDEDKRPSDGFCSICYIKSFGEYIDIPDEDLKTLIETDVKRGWLKEERINELSEKFKERYVNVSAKVMAESNEQKGIDKR